MNSQFKKLKLEIELIKRELGLYPYEKISTQKVYLRIDELLKKYEED